MRVKDVIIGEFYRVRNNDFAWAQAVEIIPPKTGVNNTNSTLVKCNWVTSKKDKFGLIKYFKVSSLVKEKE